MRKTPNGIECSIGEEIARVGRISVRANCNGKWFDVYQDDFNHLFGSSNMGEAWLFVTLAASA